MPNRILMVMLTAVAACAGPRPEAEAAPEGAETLPADPSGAVTRADTAGLGAALGPAGLSAVSALGRSGPHLAVTARHADGRLHVAALRRTDGGYVLLGADPLMENVPPQRVAWPSLSGVPAFAYTHDLPTEGVVSTLVYQVTGDSLHRVYGDPGAVCRPAELRDLDGDGTPELVTYPEEASGGDCSSECHLALRERFGMGPHWTSALRWNGRVWQPAEERYPAFYGQVAERYRQARRWMAQGGGVCDAERVPWRREDPDAVDRWIRRAETLSRGSAAGE